MPDQDDETIHIPGLGEQENVAGGGVSAGNAVPEMPPGSDAEDIGRGTMDNAARSETGGDLDATDMAQPTSTADTTGDRATGLTGG
jgi:hypothetical protein